MALCNRPEEKAMRWLLLFPLFVAIDLVFMPNIAGLLATIPLALVAACYAKSFEIKRLIYVIAASAALLAMDIALVIYGYHESGGNFNFDRFWEPVKHL